MRRISVLILALLALGAAAAGVAGASTKRAPKSTLQVLNTHRYGAILTNGSGYVVYGFALDKRKHDACEAVPHCLELWPPVKAPRTLVLGRGVQRSLVGSIRLKNGTRQLTYNGWPLYTYVQDFRPKQTSNINTSQDGGNWPAIGAKTGNFVPKQT